MSDRMLTQQEYYNEHVYWVWENVPVLLCGVCKAEHPGTEKPPKGWSLSVRYEGSTPDTMTPHLPRCQVPK